MMLLGFLVLIMMGLRNYLLPQLSSQNFATQLIGHLPTIFLLTVLILLGLTGAIYLVFKGQKLFLGPLAFYWIFCKDLPNCLLCA